MAARCLADGMSQPPHRPQGFNDDRHGDGQRVSGATGEILLVGSLHAVGALLETLESDGHRVALAADLPAARRMLLEARYHVVVADLDECAAAAMELSETTQRLSPGTVFILRSRNTTVEVMAAAMRAGVGDYLVGSVPVAEMRARIQAAVERGREGRERIERVTRLRHLCRQVVARRHGDGSDLERLASLMGDASADGDAARAHLPPPRSFDDEAAMHLDPESLVTAAVEHLALVLGPVNVALFLGTGECRFGLAAYARADLPRARIEPLFLQWAAELCPTVAAGGRLLTVGDASTMAHGQAGGEVLLRPAMVAPCRDGDVCDAVVLILGAPRVPFLPGAGEAVDRFRHAFARQLARIHRVHSRHRFQWPREDE